CTAPLVLAPAMDTDMWENPITQANIQALRERGAVIVGPGYGRLASGRIGAGRLVATEEILGAIRQTLGRKGPLMGARLVVTAGGTQEPLDPVRHLTNRSSGKMGYALAEAARDAGAQVTLITAPTALSAPYGVERVPVRTAAEMEVAVLGRLAETDILLMAAAVADYRPKVTAAQKIKKGEGPLTLELEKTADILAEVAQRRPSVGRPLVVVGFAAETEHLFENAAAKMQAKRLDLMVANDVSSPDSGFEVDTNRVILLTSDGGQETLPLMSKADVAEHIIARVAEMWRRIHG
ncbi:MAG: bifunctional phosphopantothenoylcysteine decarboxylase/phosphopantothenate--cysteine ligase CoaBC, partial [Chloroflexi bacterium]|nr:bifunctional phosphopantothenoylcysteine decarboxylase/phosphopantothenate--cysteine ligase CoaBC [Chloroflexota bacterium]